MTPEPTIVLIISAVRVQRPMTRTSCRRDSLNPDILVHSVFLHRLSGLESFSRAGCKKEPPRPLRDPPKSGRRNGRGLQSLRHAAKVGVPAAFLRWAAAQSAYGQKRRNQLTRLVEMGCEIAFWMVG